MSLDLDAARAWLLEHLSEPVEIVDEDALDRAAAALSTTVDTSQAGLEGAA